MTKLFPTSLVGSYAQPDWLIDRARLAGRFPPRVRAKELWRVEPALLGQAQDDGTVLAIRAQADRTLAWDGGGFSWRQIVAALLPRLRDQLSPRTSA